MLTFGDWRAVTRTERDIVTASHAGAAAAMLDLEPDRFDSGAALPAGWHWFFFRPLARRSALGPDGHARRGTFLPPVTLPRRMWAGGRLRFLAPLKVGDAIERESEVISVQEKEGRTGKLALVTVRYVVRGPEGVAVEEEQDLVYREAARPGEPAPAPPPPPDSPEWSETFVTDSVLLFRFSALTYNGHRIHYDLAYARDTEGYPGLVVHGPMIALLLLAAGQRHAGRAAAAYSYRAVGPLFNEQPIVLSGRGSDGAVEVWATGPNGGLATRATMTLA